MQVVFGGVFNPPTIAHYEAAKIVMEHFDVDRFIFLPVGQNYILKDIAESKHRYQMVKLLADTIGAEVSRIEIDADDFLGSYEVMNQLELTDGHFLMGSDNLKNFSKWRNTEKLIREYHLIVLKRQDDVDEIIKQDPLLSKYKDRIKIINTFDYNVSSTMYRNSREDDLIHSLIEDYIKEHNLYGGSR